MTALRPIAAPLKPRIMSHTVPSVSPLVEGKLPATPRAIAKVVSAILSIGSTPRTAANGATVHNGIAVAISSGLIEFAGKSTKVRPRLALLTALLARGSPNPIGQQFLIERIWTGQRITSDAADVLDQLAKELSSAVASIGLEIKITKGVGIGLRVAE